MTKEEMIKQTAEGFELPVEQVALIWSVFEYFGSINDQVLWEDLEEFIMKKF